MPRAPKPCGHHGCDERVPGGTTYCDEHQAEHERLLAGRRGTAHRRGYDRQHQGAGAVAKERVRRAARDGHPIDCPRCGQPMLAHQQLDWGHTTARALDSTSRAERVEHAHCNRSAGIA